MLFIPVLSHSEFLLDDPTLQLKEEIVQGDGAVYRGQCKQNLERHGYGI
jgi:hypothetical protein